MRRFLSGLLDPLSPKARHVVIFAMGVAATAAVLLLVFAIVTAATKTTQIRDTQETNTQKADARDETLAIIKDCTQPGGKCYERGQRQTAALLSSAQRIIILSAACAVDVDATQAVEDRVQQISDCVTKRLTRGG